MSDLDVTLTAILDRGRHGEEAEALLAAIVDGGVYVPVDGQGSVLFVSVDDSGPVLPGYVSDASRRQWLPSSSEAVLCDALRLIDIAEHTGVRTLAVFSTEQWAKVPLDLVARTLFDRGLRTQSEQTVELTWSRHPLALALRQAVADRILSFPAVRTVWLAHARWSESGSEQLMVHMDASAPDAAKALLDAILSNDVTLGPGDPVVALRVFQPEETAAIREIERMGLDTVRADHALSRVEIISRQFD